MSYLSNDERVALDLYRSMYESTVRQIDSLHHHLDNIKHSMDRIISQRTAAVAPSRSVHSSRRGGENLPPTPTPTPTTTPTNRSSTRTTATPLVREEVFEFSFPLSGNTQTLARDFQSMLQQFNQPVTVAPTYEQIVQATEERVFSEIEEPINMSCPISMEPFQPDQMVCQIKHCRHLFNRDSLYDWFSNNVRCPVCRYDIREDSPAGIPTIPSSSDLSNNLFAELSRHVMSDFFGETSLLMNNNRYIVDNSNNPFAVLSAILQPRP